jgi:hypothetical protein
MRFLLAGMLQQWQQQDFNWTRFPDALLLLCFYVGLLAGMQQQQQQQLTPSGPGCSTSTTSCTERSKDLQEVIHHVMQAIVWAYGAYCCACSASAALREPVSRVALSCHCAEPVVGLLPSPCCLLGLLQQVACRSITNVTRSAERMQLHAS